MALQEVSHVRNAQGRASPPPALLVPTRRIPLRQLWASLPEPVRRQTLQTLSQVILRRLVQPSGQEVGHERH